MGVEVGRKSFVPRTYIWRMIATMNVGHGLLNVARW